MCFTQKTIHTHTQALATVLGFCHHCEVVYNGVDVSTVSASKVLENYWKFKAVQKWHHPVDPLMVPASALTQASMRLCQSWYSFARTEKEVTRDMVMAVSVQSLVHALGEPVTHPSCDLCRTKHRTDICRIAVGGQMATVSWAVRLANAGDIFKSYEVSRELSHTSNVENMNRGDYGDESRLSPDMVRSPKLTFASPELPADSPPPRRLNIHERRQIEFQERQRLFAELAANHEKGIQRLKEQAELEIRAEEAFRKTLAASNDATAAITTCTSLASADSSRPHSPSDDYTSAFVSFSGVNIETLSFDDDGSSECGSISRPLHYDDSTYAALSGGIDNMREVHEFPGPRQAAIVKPEDSENMHSCYGEMGSIEEEDSDDPEYNYRLACNQSDIIDDHLEFYFKNVTGENCSASDRNCFSASNLKLPDIPPLSPLQLTGLDVPIETANHSEPRPGSSTPSHTTELSRRQGSMENTGPRTESGEGHRIASPTSPKSLTAAPFSGPEMHLKAPPRRLRGPIYCPEHAIESNADCHGCQAGRWVEVGLPPGDHVQGPEPKPI
ncbi:hypothetical protein CORC01_11336 [Colletotrichum orchidophilum]|uniref:Uncharacterized protein n=1 Tax=Colletotrichum orchidophilum TaxID=1209926 RepID=A0A1G4AWA1_9PEZI|nr:uncharacterized protein CORC01_11336 [Colletotrichum orchidophilum]OHE93386.1 hypothetical protein CORC01_11336 [Colletotrichum orchidophilum]